MFFKKNKDIDDKVIRKAAMDLRKGSAEAFHILYHKYKTPVYKFCTRLLNDKDLADDAFQETFVRVYEKRKLFNGENFKGWVFTIARNTCFNYLRTKKMEVEFDEEYIAPETMKMGDYAMKDLIEKAIAELPVSYREVVVLREYEEYSYTEIAEILDIELSLVKIRIHRARLLLKKKLQPLVKEIYGTE